MARAPWAPAATLVLLATQIVLIAQLLSCYRGGCETHTPSTDAQPPVPEPPLPPQPRFEQKPLVVSPMQLIIPESFEREGAVCLDGTPGGFYYRQGSPKNASKWVIWLEGGGWCYNNVSCEERRSRLANLGTLRGRPRQRAIKLHFGSADPATNPDFHDWTHVIVAYCDGTSFLGNREQPLSVAIAQNKGERVPIYFRGYRILSATIRFLFDRHSLAAADTVIFGGHSAGGMAALIHLDQFASKFDSKATRVVGVVDASIFIDFREASAHGRTHCRALEGARTLWNATGLHPQCVQGEADADWRCIFPGYLLRYLRTPIFFVQDRYDNWATKNVLGMTWISYDHRASLRDLYTLHAYSAGIEKAIVDYLSVQPQGGVWLSSCRMAIHGETTMPYWLRHHIRRTSLRNAVSRWVFQRCSHDSTATECPKAPQLCGPCRFVEDECDWTVRYGRNLSLVRDGKLAACIGPHPDKRVGKRVLFLPACPADMQRITDINAIRDRG
eukprot:TRINITY_DN12849_c0_g1_i3.p1 TRINITY_DN12849_c0_g1~~TRINITY_DN12849_c0_g1_i3.p1  ORF type:complete len:500 (+),score=54.03 TRINITY_DN12849_c0_g1_i3:1395-2894(+)